MLIKGHHEKLLHDNITQTYQKRCYQTKKKIDREAKKFNKSLGLDERMECYSKQSAFITLKSHNASFKNNTKCRLINPSKSEVSLFSKHYRAGKIRFSGAWKSVLLKTSSGERCAPQNFVHLATFRGTRAHFIVYLVVHQMKYLMERWIITVKFCDFLT